MIVLRPRPTRARKALWREIERRIDAIASMNRRRAPIIRGAAHYDARGWREDNRDLYTFDGRRIHFSNGRPMYAMAGGVWAPPIGIPNPGWGIDTPVRPALPSPWNGNVANFYYVAQGGPNSGNGFPASPRSSIPNPIPPGAVVVMDNAAPWLSNFQVTAGGTSGNPCFLVGSSLSETNRAVVQIANDAWLDGTYCVMEFLDFQYTGSGVGFNIGLNAGTHDHIAMRFCEMRGNGSSLPSFAAIGLSSFTGQRTRTHVVLYDNFLHDIGDWTNTTQDLDRHGIKVDTINTNVWIVDNLFEQIGADSIQIGPQPLTPVESECRFIYAGRNRSYQTRETGGWIKGAFDVVYSQNDCENNGTPSLVGGPGQGMGLQEGATRAWFLFNHIYSTSGAYGIDISNHTQSGTEGTEHFVIGNVIHDQLASGVVGVHLRAPVNTVVAHNTIFNVGTGISKPANDGASHIIHDNIIDNVVTRHLDFADPNATIFRNNLLAPGGAALSVAYGGTTYTNKNIWESASGGNASGNIGAPDASTDPAYVDSTNGTIANRNFKLVAGSVGINQGNATEAAAYARFQTLYGLDIRRDFNDLIRPQGGTWDIGAFEFGSGGDVTAPTVSITSPTTAATYVTAASTVDLAGTADDNVGVAFVTWVNSAGGGGTAVGTTAWTIDGITLAVGANVITVTAHDAAGNLGTDVLTVTRDITGPVVTITTPTSSPTFSTGTSPLATLSGNASDPAGVSSVTWVNDRGGSGTATGTTSWSVSNITLQNGVNVLTVTGTDSVGNTGTDVLTVTFTVPDTTPPSVAISQPASSGVYTTNQPTVFLAGTASDNVGVSSVTWVNDRGGSGTASGTTTWSVTSVTLAVGANVITVTARDAALNQATAQITVTRQDLNLPVTTRGVYRIRYR